MKLPQLQEAKYRGKYPEGTAGWVLDTCFVKTDEEGSIGPGATTYEIKNPYQLMWTHMDALISFADVDGEGNIYFEGDTQDPYEHGQSVKDRISLYITKQIF